MKIKFYLAITIFLFCINSFATQNVKKELKHLITQIQDVKKIIHERQRQQIALQQDLRQTEVNISKVSLKLQKTGQALNSQKLAVAKLNKKQQDYELQIQHQQALLLQQIKLTYLLGVNKKNYNILLRNEDISKLERLLTYHHYLNKDRSNLIKQLQHTIEELEDNKQELMEHVKDLNLLKTAELFQQHELDKNKQTRSKVLQSLAAQVKTHTEHLNELLKNKKSLENMIVQLQKQQSYSSEYLTHHKGKFAWPTVGKLVERFGKNIEDSQLKQNGVLIKAPLGQKVYAVAPGKVIFADWMPGYGLLMIIDHGKGYMTLYGNNSVLYKQIHQLVASREVIASVGYSGGQKNPALYFALRHQGKAIDPCIWCGT